MNRLLAILTTEPDPTKPGELRLYGEADVAELAQLRTTIANRSGCWCSHYHMYVSPFDPRGGPGQECRMNAGLDAFHLAVGKGEVIADADPRAKEHVIAFRMTATKPRRQLGGNAIHLNQSNVHHARLSRAVRLLTELAEQNGPPLTRLGIVVRHVTTKSWRLSLTLPRTTDQ